MKQVKLLYRKKKKKEKKSTPSIFGLSVLKEVPPSWLKQINFASDKTTAAAFAFYTKPALFVASLSLWLAAFVRSRSLKRQRVSQTSAAREKKKKKKQKNGV